ncbi:hypothetical protein [Photobacterium alginatilyticum]|uniref:hypothetical protein n=1 Tax=Photobacterium alginatilyticum TaxID=1775171 RepID=UPI001367EBD1|nr:hypothetical protein [Photobacterium alginatilyticum]
MQKSTTFNWSVEKLLDAIFEAGFIYLLKGALFLDELEKYDRQSKAMRREDRRQEYLK